MRRRKRRGRRYGRRLSQRLELRMTSMMDILVVLLLFLLKSFVVGGEIVNPPPGLELPKSTAEMPPEESIVIAIDDDAISIGSEKVISIEETVNGNGLMIEPLSARLQEVREQRDEIARLQGHEYVEEELITIQGDRKIEFRVLQKVMYTLSENGYENVALAVIRTSEKRGS